MKKRSLQELNRLDELSFKKLEKFPIVLVMDNIRSAGNIGAAFRTADAFALEKIILTGISAKPPHREILKTAIGASKTVMWEYKNDTLTAVKKLEKNGYLLIPVEQTDNAIQLQDFKMSKNDRIALIFGNEVTGVSDDVIDSSNYSIEIPQFGTKHSLNVSVSLGIVCWALVSQLIS